MNTLRQQNEAHFHVCLDQRRLKVTIPSFLGADLRKVYFPEVYTLRVKEKM